MEISRKEANRYIKSVMSHMNERDQNANLEKLSPKAKAYYTSNLISFVFSKEDILDLFHNESVNSVRIYYAAEPESGIPSLVLIPAKNDTYKKFMTNELQSDAKAGQQYPNPRLAKAATDGIDAFDVGTDNTSYADDQPTAS